MLCVVYYSCAVGSLVVQRAPKDLPWADTVPVAIMGAEERGGVLVELGDFVRLVGPFLPVDYDAECGC